MTSDQTVAPTPPLTVDDVALGQAITPLVVRVTRKDLVKYAGASRDFNAIHWSDSAAAAVGLPGVIVHGTLTMAYGARAVLEWVGDPGALAEYTVRFAKPVVVPDDADGAEITLEGRVAAIRDGGLVQIDLRVTSAGERVLGLARVVVRLRPNPDAGPHASSDA